jgi:hypothetical protein
MKEYIRWEAHSARKKSTKQFFFPKPIGEKLLCVTWHDHVRPPKHEVHLREKQAYVLLSPCPSVNTLRLEVLSFSRRCFREHCVNRFMAPGVFEDRNATIFKCQGAQTLRSFEMSGTVNPATHSHNPSRPISSTLHLCYENQPDNAVQINKRNHCLF